MTTELFIPALFDLDEEVVLLDQNGDLLRKTIRQLLLGERNIHTVWISQKFSCRCRLIDPDTQLRSGISCKEYPSISSVPATYKRPGFILDRGTEMSLQNAKVAVTALIDATIELVETLQATENRVLELTNDVSFIRWYEAEHDPESQETRKAIVAQISNTLLEEGEEDIQEKA